MTNALFVWEGALQQQARAALEGWQPAPIRERANAGLGPAYEQCARITRHHSRTFYLASGLLPPAKRRAARALYAFCRLGDEIVDRGSRDAAPELRQWRLAILAGDTSSNPVLRAWSDTQRRYQIPALYVQQFLDGVGRDLYCRRYETFGELAQYCYGVACTVGLMSMHIVGFSGEEAIPYAVRLGVALQMTNILRDVDEDWQAGRLYLPRSDLHRFGLQEDDIAARRAGNNWRAFMEFQVARIRRLYAASWPGIAMLNRDGRFAIAAASALYEAILDDIVRRRGNVFGYRAHVTALGKARLLPLIWWRVRGLTGSRAAQPGQGAGIPYSPR